jgi:hypothetical protein
MMNIIQILQDDYQRFPANQTYSIYTPDVYFQDPLNKFRGVDKFQRAIAFIEKWFIAVKLDIHEIHQSENLITTRWTLHWTAPLPWQPRIAIPGWSELELNPQGLISSHIDYWECSRFDVLKQLFLQQNR